MFRVRFRAERHALAKSFTVCAVLAFAAPSLADAPVEPVRLAYTAPDGCPSQAEVERALASKLGEATLARPEQLARRLEIAIAPIESGFRAQLQLVDRAGNRVSRHVSSPTCAQAAQAIVLVAVLAAKAQRQTEAPSDPLPPSESVPAAKPEPDRPAPASFPSSPPPSKIDGGATELLLSIGAATGVGPGIAPGIGLAGRWSLGRAGPSFVLLAAVHDSFARETAAAEARFRRISAGIVACPFEPRLSGSLALAPCAGYELGAHSGRAYDDGERVVRGRSESLFFAQALLALRLRSRFDAVVLELGPDLGLQLFENEFALRPNERVYEVPAVTGAVRLAIGLNFQAFSR
jgi:hypothetical protein